MGELNLRGERKHQLPQSAVLCVPNGAKIKRAYDREYIKKYYKELKMLRDLIFKYMQAEKAVRDFLKKMEKTTKAKTGKSNRILITANNFLKLKTLTQKADAITRKFGNSIKKLDKQVFSLYFEFKP